ncbi:hypothetical protein [Sporolactobacillus sp. KGMB 08714]|uniref:hypothetical protein n=1 Tax=Sporolactobacillus sp. KGMB 08714 TaxID=3064704 RepID=UPI002FBD59DE
MERALIFGGLSPQGFPLSEILLEKGLQVVSLSTALNEDERQSEDERELFLGRNALFQIEKAAPEAFDYLFLTDMIRPSPKSNARLKEKWIKMFLPHPPAVPKSSVLLSSLEICGGNEGRRSESMPVHPRTALGKAADEMESYFAGRLGKAGDVQTVIFRTDLGNFTDRRKGRRTAELMAELAFADFPGSRLEVIHFTDDLQGDPASNRKIKTILRGKIDWL